MAQLFKSFIPGEFLDAWMRGRYVIGPRTLDYRYAGLALILRGFYRYDVWVESKVTDNNPTAAKLETPKWGQTAASGHNGLFGGYAALYIKDHELSLAGFRVYACREDEETPLFWKSVFSRFVENQEGKTELYFPYYIYRTRNASRDLGKRNSIRELARSCKKRNDLDELESNIMSGNERSSQLVHDMLSELFHSAGGSIENPELRGLCMLRPPERDVHSPDNEPLTWDLALRGQNYGVDVPISGTVEFRRLTGVFLQHISRGERTPA